MKLMIADYPVFVVPLYPLVAFGGMLQIDSLIAISKWVPGLNLHPTTLQVFSASAVIYSVILTAFLLVMNGDNLIFKACLLISMSAIFGIFIFFGLQVLVYIPSDLAHHAVSLNSGAIKPYFNLAVLILDLVASVAFLFRLTGHNLHKISRPLIFSSQVFTMAGALGMLLWSHGVLQALWRTVMLRLHTTGH